MEQEFHCQSVLPFVQAGEMTAPILNATLDLRLYLCTWNVSQAAPPKDFEQLFNLNGGPQTDLIVVGLQEVDASVSAYVNDTFFDDPWTYALSKALKGSNFVRVKSIRLLGMLLIVFAKREHVPCITKVDVQYTRTGIGGYWGNKGGVSIRMDIHGVNICFVNCHLAAHDYAVSQRIVDYDTILEQQQFEVYKDGKMKILDHDYVFWLGDLNFRLEDIERDKVLQALHQGNVRSLWENDQLTRLRQDDMLFVDFEEGKLNFPCSYKYNRGTDEYDNSKKKRKPAWCDRILWLAHEDSFIGANLTVRQHSYESVQEYRESDHKPVVSQFTFKGLKYFESPVLFDISDWDHLADGIINYRVSEDLDVSSWDWIGLYRADYSHTLDYVMYLWASTDCLEKTKEGYGLYRAVIGKISLLSFIGDFFLVYHSSKYKSAAGHSRLFTIR